MRVHRVSRLRIALLLLCGMLAMFDMAAWGRGSLLLPHAVGVDGTFDTVQDENICELARRWGLAPEHVAFANRIPADEYVYPHRHLVVPLRRLLPRNPPRDGIVINVPERALYYFRGGRYAGFFPVAVGRIGFPTPRGQFHVVSKVKDPTWFPPAWASRKTPFLPGKDNPLGSRWIGLSSRGLGIHGTGSPYSIGMSTSHGCIRMYPEHVLRLFEWVRVGTSVRIEYETVKIGRDERGSACMAAFPDVYGLQSPVRRAKVLVREVGLAKGVVARADAIARQQTGVVESLEEALAPAP